MKARKPSLAALKKLVTAQGLAVQELARRLDDAPLKVIDMLLHLKGKAVFCGMGKSGHIAHKVAATMSSTGTPAIYLHPTESLHGDLGMVARDDVVFLISKSGENPELNLMAPSLRRMGVPIIAVTFNKESSLARLAQVVVDLGEVREICPLELAPTTSATLTLVLLDSIAMEVMRLKDFRPEEYALFHPSGRLGRRLVYNVRDLMVPVAKAPTINADATPMDMLHAITAGRMGVVIVCDGRRRLQGYITDNDVRRTLENQRTFFKCKIADIMNPAPLTCLDTDNAYEVLLRMRTRERPITSMPVLDAKGLCSGLLRLEDMVQHGLV